MLQQVRALLRPKPLLWAFVGLCCVWVFALYEYPIFHAANGHRDHLYTVRFLIIPHIVGGLAALALGPLLFSTRFRLRRPKLHRNFGRVYVIGVCVASNALIFLNRHDTAAMDLLIDWEQVLLWLSTTIMAFLCARNGHYATHREWMIRSYALTTTFLGTRVLMPFRFYSGMSDNASIATIIALDFLCLLLPDIAFSWRQATTSRRNPLPVIR
jgi:uncharacterized membrane protein